MRAIALTVLGALALAGCSSTSDQAAGGALAGARAGAGASAAAPAPIDQQSLEFFKVRVGDRVFFNTDQTELTAEARGVLDRQAAWLNQNPARRIRIEGHADERGTRAYNLALGARRASTVATYLAAQGVDRARMETVSFGRERPVATCSQEQCWAQNRRAVTAPL